MGCLLALGVLVLVLFVGMWASFQLLGILFTLLVAGMVGALADAIIPGKLPGGWLGAVLAGIAGGFLGSLLFRLVNLGQVGPSIAGVPVIPAFVGAIVIAGAVELVSNTRARRYMQLPSDRDRRALR